MMLLAVAPPPPGLSFGRQTRRPLIADAVGPVRVVNAQVGEGKVSITT